MLYSWSSAQPGLWICVADPLRVGHELTYFPGNVNFAAADVIDINKANTAHHVRPWYHKTPATSC